MESMGILVFLFLLVCLVSYFGSSLFCFVAAAAAAYFRVF